MIPREYLAKRLVQAAFTFFVVLLLNFTIPRLMPGDPARILANEGMLPKEAVDTLVRTFNLDRPYHEQLVSYLVNAFRGDFGFSYKYYPTTVMELLLTRLPWTILLLGLATITTSIFGIVIGLVCAWKRESKTDVAALSVSIFIWAIPYFWLAMVLLYLFGYIFPIFPLGHGVTVGARHGGFVEYLGDVLWHLALPVIAITLTGYASYSLITRNTMIETLAEDYVLTAEAKGLSERQVLLRHAARNALLPLVTMIALRLGFIVSGAIFTETVFSYPGVGLLIYESIMYQDFPVLQGAFFILSVTVIVANLTADVLYSILDPRIKYR